jgi:sulfite exporter TauE/SafE
MPVEALVAAFIIGFTGSLHCVGMCGPLAMIVPLRGNKWLAIFTYHFSRIFVYASLGLVFGLFGTQLSVLQGGQRFSIVLGVALLIVFVVPVLFPKWSISGKLTGYSIGLFSRLSKPAMQSKSVWSVAVLGAFNGLLPCGLIYISLAGAVSSGSAFNGALFMAAVGFGTLPAMITIMSLRQYVGSGIKRLSKFAVPVIASTLAVFLIVRGLNLDIPYLSPKVEKVSTAGSEVCD